jgi:hypothetical protein
LPEVVIEGHKVLRPVELLEVRLIFDNIDVKATGDLVVWFGVRNTVLLATRSEHWETWAVSRVVNAALYLVDSLGEERIRLGRIDGP